MEKQKKKKNKILKERMRDLMTRLVRKQSSNEDRMKMRQTVDRNQKQACNPGSSTGQKGRLQGGRCQFKVGLGLAQKASAKAKRR